MHLPSNTAWCWYRKHLLATGHILNRLKLLACFFQSDIRWLHRCRSPDLLRCSHWEDKPTAAADHVDDRSCHICRQWSGRRHISGEDKVPSKTFRFVFGLIGTWVTHWSSISGVRHRWVYGCTRIRSLLWAGSSQGHLQGRARRLP